MKMPAGVRRASMKPLSMAVAAVLLQTGASAWAALEAAKPADAFVDSIGVNIHTGPVWDSTPYVQWNGVVSAIGDIGFRYVRDVPEDPAKLNQLTAATGAKVMAIMQYHHWDQRADLTYFDTVMNAAKSLTGLALMEGINEYDGSGDPNWVTTLTSWQQRLYTTAKADPQLAAIPIVAPSMYPGNVPLLGPQGLAAWTDLGNYHDYPTGVPTIYTQGHIDGSNALTGGKPIIVSEVGYSTAVNFHDPLTFGMSEQAQAKYATRLYMDYFSRGIQKTFWYELVNIWPDPNRGNRDLNMGLLDESLRYKPAAVAIKNLISLLGDPGTSFAPDSLDYDISGGDSTLRHLLLQQADGRFYLALWRDLLVYDPSTGDLANADLPVTLHLNTPITSAETFLPNGGTQPIAQLGANSVLSLNVPDQLLLVELDPVLAAITQWLNSSTGSWTATTNWSQGNVPDGVGSTARFLGAIAADAVVTLDGDRTVGDVVFDHNKSYTIAQGTGGSLRLDNGGAGAAVTVVRGSHSITAPVVLNDNASFVINAGSLSISGSISSSVSSNVSKSGPGTLVLSADNTYSGITTVSGGKLIVNNPTLTASGTGSSAVIVTAGGTLGGSGSVGGSVTVNAGGHVAPGDGLGTLRVASLTLNAGSVLDLEGGSSGFDLIKLTGGSAPVLSGTASVNIADLGGLGSGTYHVVQYAGTALGDINGLFIPAAMPAGNTVSFGLSSSGADNFIDVVLTHVQPSLLDTAWNVDADGAWSAAGNWTPGAPTSGSTTIARFGSAITAARSVTLDADATVSTIEFNGAHTYTIAGTHTLTLGGVATVNVLAGSHEIAVPLVLAPTLGNVTMSVANSADTLTLSGDVSGTANGTTGVTKTGAGKLVIGRTIQWGGNTTVIAGQMEVQDFNPATESTAVVSVNGGKLLANSIRAASLNIAASATVQLRPDAAEVSLVKTLAISAGGRLDLANNALIVDYAGGISPLAAIQAQIRNAYNPAGGTSHWTQPGITSSLADGDMWGLGYAEASDVTVDLGGTFEGQTLTETQVLVKYTVYGDANLDGTVGFADFVAFNQNMGSSGIDWSGGDFNYDGTVGFGDFVLLTRNFGGILPGDGGGLAPAGGAMVPEPGTLLILASAGLLSVGRRRRRIGLHV